MSACETCWGDAYARSLMFGGSQVEHYQALLIERAAYHEQRDPAPTAAGEGERGEG